MKEQWLFPYPADKLTDAVERKLDYHNDRFTWWKQKNDEKFAEIKSSGLSVHESVGANSSPSWSNSTYNNQPTITIDQNLTAELNECQRKVAEHRNKIVEYEGWRAVLSSQGQASFNLNQQDWLFFFGTK